MARELLDCSKRVLTMATQAEKAEIFRALHRGPEILVLANVWDCASARIVEEAGFPAIATTSAGVANALGYPDGESIPAAEMLAAVRRIAGCVRVPVSADLEGGYQDVAATAAGLVASGAIGLNLEDAGGDPVQHAARIATVRRVGRDLGVSLVINARTDLYLDKIGDPAPRFERSCERLHAYIEAGADCVFVPGVTDEDTIRRFVEALRFPLNILATAGAPPIPRLQQLGVARVSLGSGIARATLSLTRRIAQELKTSGSYDAMLQDAIPYAELNRLFEKHATAKPHHHPRP
jgi:2-methylisocitrate lyase-like PEP mutase family enzyme